MDVDALRQWVAAYDGTFPFLLAMRERVEKGEALSGGMLHAIERSKRRADAEVARNTPDPYGIDLFAWPVTSAKGMTLHAVPNKDGVPVYIRIDRPKNGKWRGTAFVKQLAGDGTVTGYCVVDRGGKQTQGGSYLGNLKGQVLRISQAPHDSIRAYGMLTYRCGYCARKMQTKTDRKAGGHKDCLASTSQGTQSDAGSE
jgi:hypothetical protein